MISTWGFALKLPGEICEEGYLKDIRPIYLQRYVANEEDRRNPEIYMVMKYYKEKDDYEEPVSEPVFAFSKHRRRESVEGCAEIIR